MFADVFFNVVFNPLKSTNFSKENIAGDVYPLFQYVFLHFLKKLQEANEYLEQQKDVSSAIDELCSKQHFFENFVVDKVKGYKFCKPQAFERSYSNKSLWRYFHSRLTVLDLATIPQFKLFSLFLKNFFWFLYQFSWNTLDQPCFENFSNQPAEQEWLPFLSKMKKVNQNLLQNSKLKLKIVLIWK